jgi:hypothetical protein
MHKLLTKIFIFKIYFKYNSVSTYVLQKFPTITNLFKIFRKTYLCFLLQNKVSKQQIFLTSIQAFKKCLRIRNSIELKYFFFNIFNIFISVTRLFSIIAPTAFKFISIFVYISFSIIISASMFIFLWIIVFNVNAFLIIVSHGLFKYFLFSFFEVKELGRFTICLFFYLTFSFS